MTLSNADLCVLGQSRVTLALTAFLLVQLTSLALSNTEICHASDRPVAIDVYKYFTEVQQIHSLTVHWRNKLVPDQATT